MVLVSYPDIGPIMIALATDARVTQAPVNDRTSMLVFDPYIVKNDWIEKMGVSAPPTVRVQLCKLGAGRRYISINGAMGKSACSTYEEHNHFCMILATAQRRADRGRAGVLQTSSSCPANKRRFESTLAVC